jgi:hypothetical protein
MSREGLTLNLSLSSESLSQISSIGRPPFSVLPEASQGFLLFKVFVTWLLAGLPVCFVFKEEIAPTLTNRSLKIKAEHMNNALFILRLVNIGILICGTKSTDVEQEIKLFY